MTFSNAASQEEKLAYFEAAIRQYIAAIGAQDLEAILALFAEDAAVHDPVGQRNFHGKNALRDFYAGVITRAVLEISGPIRGSFANAVATPLRAKVPGVEIDVITIARFNDQGLIEDYAAYWGPNNLHPQSTPIIGASNCAVR